MLEEVWPAEIELSVYTIPMGSLRTVDDSYGTNIKNWKVREKNKRKGLDLQLRSILWETFFENLEKINK